ncbi:hypothetical protein GCM10009733_007460 [Nonomuraea maheshkhaliensis]|uniref:HIT domain-containing protein n=1 Tax=Nonomuraea maheshkhaliensis TaxID=419590 RepID=A0ABP4QQ04_9ACTN
MAEQPAGGLSPGRANPRGEAAGPQRCGVRRQGPVGGPLPVGDHGRAAGQSIKHLHIHMIPRYVGDVEDPRGGIRQAAPNWNPDSWL